MMTNLMDIGLPLIEMKVISQNKPRWSTRTAAYAAMFGDLKTLKYLYDEGCPFDVWTTRLAAKEGHLDVLKWAVLNNIPWNQSTVDYAAWGGNTECFNHLINIGGKIKLSTYIFAMIGGNDGLLRKRRSARL